MNRVARIQGLASKCLGLTWIVLGAVLLTACGKEKSDRRQELPSEVRAPQPAQSADSQVIVAMPGPCPALTLDEEEEGEEDEDGSDRGPGAKPDAPKGNAGNKAKKDQDMPVEKSCPNPPAQAPAPTPAPPTAPAPALDGAALYGSQCMSCHGAKAQTSVENKTFAGIKAAMTSVGAHRNVASIVTDPQLNAISVYLMAP